MGRLIFVTGTDTGVGKTAVTALLLAQAQAQGTKVRALKPISTGDGGDENLLGAMQEREARINFFHFAEPIAPWSAARLHGMRVSLAEVLAPIRAHAAECDLLLVEGAGGLLTPLGEEFTAANLISDLGAEVIVVAANRLGVLNHTVLTVEALRRRAVEKIQVVLVELAGADGSRKTNLGDLRVLLPGVPIRPLPFLENYSPEAEYIRKASAELSTELADVLWTEAG